LGRIDRDSLSDLTVNGYVIEWDRIGWLERIHWGGRGRSCEKEAPLDMAAGLPAIAGATKSRAPRLSSCMQSLN
jgi:hypothetical protein